MRESIGIWVASVLLAGCAASPYVQPDGPNTARLVVANSSGETLPLYTFENAESCSGLIALHPRAGVPMGDSFIVRIAAGAPFTLSAKGSTAPPGSFGTAGGALCSAAATFLPASGKSYLAIFRATGTACTLQVNERVSGGDGSPAKFVPERSFRGREESACR